MRSLYLVALLVGTGVATLTVLVAVLFSPMVAPPAVQGIVPQSSAD